MNRNFRLGHLSRKSYASFSSTNNEFATRADPNEISGISSAGFGVSDKARLLPCKPRPSGHVLGTGEFPLMDVACTLALSQDSA